MTSPNLKPAASALVDRRDSSHGYGSVGGVFEDKLANLNADFLDPKFPEEMRCEIVGQGLQKLGRLQGEEVFRFLAKSGIIDSARESVLKIAEVADGPKSNIKNQTLALGPLSSWNADMSKDFQLLNVNLLLSTDSHFLKALTEANPTSNRDSTTLVSFSRTSTCKSRSDQMKARSPGMKSPTSPCSLRPLALSSMGVRPIIAARESGTGRQKFFPLQSVPNNALEHGPFLCANRRNPRRSSASIDRTVSRLLATGFRIDMPSRTFGNGRSRSNPGFLCHAS